MAVAPALPKRKHQKLRKHPNLFIVESHIAPLAATLPSQLLLCRYVVVAVIVVSTAVDDFSVADLFCRFQI